VGTDPSGVPVVSTDALTWASLGLLLALLGIRAWVVETGHATLGRTPVKVKVLTAACALAVALVAGMVTVAGGAQLVYLLLHPAQAQAIEDAANAAQDASTAPPIPSAEPPPPAPAQPAPSAQPTTPAGRPAPAAPAAPAAGR
jgi:hypothetical protein